MTTTRSQQFALASRPVFNCIRVFGDSPAELEQCAREMAAPFFGDGVPLEVVPGYHARATTEEIATDDALRLYKAEILVREADPADAASAAERIRRELDQTCS